MIKANHAATPGGAIGCGTEGEEFLVEKVTKITLKHIKTAPERQRHERPR